MCLCINCNAQGVVREGDEFKCPKCKYEWDVAHEQANAAYLASQGRKPAEPLGEQPDAPETPEDALMKELGLAPESGEPEVSDAPDGDEQPDAPETPEDGYHLNVRIEGDPDGETELDSEMVIDPDDVLIRLEATTVPLLKAMAEEHEVDLAGATVKANIIERLLESGKLTAVYAPDGSLIDVE